MNLHTESRDSGARHKIPTDVCILRRGCAILCPVPEQLTADYLRQFAEAVVNEIKAEMGRKRVDSNRELARRIGFTHTSVNDRLEGNPRTKKRTVINVKDLAAYAAALGVEPGVLVQRAQAALDEQGAGEVTAPSEPPAADEKQAAVRSGMKKASGKPQSRAKRAGGQTA